MKCYTNGNVVACLFCVVWDGGGEKMEDDKEGRGERREGRRGMRRKRREEGG